MRLFRSLTAVLLANTALALQPVGYTPSGKPIFNGPPGSRLQQMNRDFHLFSRNGTLIHTFFNKQTATVARQDASLRTSQTFVTLNAPDSIKWFNASATVPPEPTTFENQIIFVGPGLQQLDEKGTPITLMQTALQYGGSPAQGGPFWTAILLVENISDTQPGFIFVVTIGFVARLNAGDSLSMSISPDPATDLPPGAIWYQAFFPSIPEMLPMEIGFVLDLPPTQLVLSVEEEGAVKASDYPSKPMVFENINLELITGYPAISWANTTVNGVPGVSMTVEKDGSQNARISVNFPQPI